MKSSRLFLLILPFTISFYAQTTLKGVVKDTNKNAIEFANVFLMDENNKLETGITTNQNGVFELAVEKGKSHILTISFVGFKSWKKNILVNKNEDLGTIILAESANKLSEIVINAKKPIIQRKVDRLVFNTSNLVSAQGGDGLDLLKIAPGLSVTDTKIGMIGKKGVVLMVDDRIISLSSQEALANYLQTLRATDIESIELITTLPAKYSASGNFGIINIKMKKTKEDSWSSSVFSDYKQATYGRITSGVSFNYKKNSFVFFSNLSYNKGAYQGIENSTILYPQQSWKEKNTNKFHNNLFTARTGFDVDLSKNWAAGLEYTGSFNKPNSTDFNNTLIRDQNDATKKATILTDGNSKTKSNLNAVNLYSTIKLDSLGRKIDINANMISFDSNQDRNFASKTTNGAQFQNISDQDQATNNIADRKINNYSLKVDVTHPFTSFNLEYGFKISSSNTKNNTQLFNTLSNPPVLDPTQSDRFLYDEQTQAVYVSTDKKLGKKWHAKLGLRVENTQLKGNSKTLNKINKQSYVEPFPTAYVSYRSSFKHAFSLEYSRRIYRPGFYEVNPFRWYSSPYSYSEGNPKLRPTFTNNIDFSYVYKDFMQTTLSYSEDKDNSGQVTVLDSNTFIQAIKRLNYFDDYNISLRQLYIFKKLKWWVSQNSATLFYNHSDSKIFPITPKSNSSFGGTFKTINNFYLNTDKTIYTGFDFTYRAPYKSGDLTDNYGRTYLNAYFRMLFLNKKLQASISGNNLLREYAFNSRSVRNGNFSYTNGYYDSQYVKFSLSYSFGSRHIQAKQRDKGNSEEKKRIQ